MKDLGNGARTHWVVGPYSYYNQYRYNPNNEPDLHAPWMYTLIGQPWKTATVVRAAQQLFTNAPNGVTGNDDLGTMSAWYLFSAFGLYPAVPGSGEFLLHAPRFKRVTLDLGNGKRLRIDAPAPMAARCSTSMASASTASRSRRCSWTGPGCSKAARCRLR